MPSTKAEGTTHISEVDKKLDATITEFSVTASSALVLFKQPTVAVSILPGHHHVFLCAYCGAAMHSCCSYCIAGYL